MRAHHNGKAVDKLIYSAYTAMAEKEGAKIVEAAMARFDIEAALCIHRVGELQIGDIAVWIGVSAGHRGSAFEACRFIIDTIKGEVPIWKHEFYRDGSAEGTLNHHCCGENGRRDAEHGDFAAYRRNCADTDRAVYS